MKNRLEYKYLVPLSDLDKLRNNLLKYLEFDEYAAVRPNKEYTVRSIYLDSYNYKCYYEKMDGIHTRKKFRIRGYNKEKDNSRVFFEIKKKDDNFVSKDRAGTSFHNAQVALTSTHPELYFDGNDRNYFENFHYYYQLKQLEPKILIVYEREPFTCKFGSELRITFDKNLRSKIVTNYNNLFDEEGFVEIFRKVFIFEVKFFQVLPQWIDRVLEKYDLTRLAVSKYTYSIDSQYCSSISMNKLTRYDS